MVNVSSAMAGQFVIYAQEMTETIEALSLNPLRKRQTAGKTNSIRPPDNSEPEVSP